jgi:hypothetical protein
MRKRLMWTLALGTALAVAVAGVAVAVKPVTLRAGNLILKVNGGTLPKKLPRKKMAPVGVWVEGKLSTANGAHAPAIRETVIDFDKNGTVNAKGLPVCKRGQLEATDTKTAERACGTKIVGKGKGKVDLQFPDQGRVIVNAPILLFNGGVKGGTTTLYIHTYIEEPVVLALVTTVKIKKIHKGRYGIRTIATIPQAAGGAGSVFSFRFKVKRIFKYRGKKVSYITARCPDGKFFAKVVKSVFKNEAEEEYPPESAQTIKIQGFPAVTNLHGNVIRPCTPKG